MGKRFGWFGIPLKYETSILRKEKEQLYTLKQEEDFAPKLRYLLKHAAQYFFKNCKIYQQKELTGLKIPCEKEEDRQMFEKAAIADVQIFQFENKVGLVMIKIDYNDMTMEEMQKFAYKFKKVFVNWETLQELHAITENFQEGVDTFFYNYTQKECLYYQFVCLDYAEKDKNTDENLIRLCRGYSAGFLCSTEEKDESIEYIYRPFSEQAWAACQTGMVCVQQILEDSEENKLSNYYAENFAPVNFDNDYFLMFIMLEYQKIYLHHSLQKMMEQHEDEEQMEKMYSEFNDFKLLSCLYVVSEDIVTQTLYSKTMNVFHVEKLLSDVQDLNETVLEQHHVKNEKRQERINDVAGLISILAIASFLIDITNYLEVWNIGIKIASKIALVLGTCGVGFFYWALGRNKKKK